MFTFSLKTEELIVSDFFFVCKYVKVSSALLESCSITMDYLKKKLLKMKKRGCYTYNTFIRRNLCKWKLFYNDVE